MSVVGCPPEYPPPPRLERYLDLVFPPTCAGCGRIGRWICSRCWPEVPWIVDQTCVQCGAQSVRSVCVRCSGGPSSPARLSAVAEFEGVAREAVHLLKFHGRHAIAGMMGRVMSSAVRDVEVDGVAHVPLHRTRLRERGYDQSARLARSVARTLGLPYYPRALTRVRPTRQQATLDAADRLANVAGAFESSRRWTGHAILLVDDVSTTGATIQAAAEALREAGAGPVVGLVFAHTP